MQIKQLKLLYLPPHINHVIINNFFKKINNLIFLPISSDNFGIIACNIVFENDLLKI